MRRRRRFRIQPRFFVFVLVLLVAAGSGVWIFMTPSSRPVYVVEGVLEGQNSAESVIVRSEVLVEADEYGKIDYLVPEGEQVANGQPIANIYKVGYSEKTVQELADLGQKIHDARQRAMSDFPEDPIHSINAGIEQKLDEIAIAVRGGNGGDVLTLEHELKSQIEGRDAYLRSSVTPDSALVDLDQKYQTKLDQISQYKETVKSSGAGTVSFYYDDLEALLRPETITNLGFEDVQNILSGSQDAKPGQAKAMTPLYRLVSSGKWYVLVLSKEGEQDFREGQKYTLSFPGYSSQEYTGTMISHKADSKGRIVDVVEMDQDVGLLLSVRKAQVQIGRRFEGLKVPAKYVVQMEGRNGVIIVNEQKQRVFVPVNILATDGQMSIIEPTVKNSLRVNTRIYR